MLVQVSCCVGIVARHNILLSLLKVPKYKMKSVLFLFVAFSAFMLPNTVYNQTPLNEVRIVASHNSYKKAPHKKVLRFLKRFKKRLGPENDPIQIDYGHEPLSVQLDSFQVRGFEFDIYNDPKGGHFRKRALNRFILGQAVRSKDKDYKIPGFKLMHIPDVDFQTNYVLFKNALEEIEQWSNAHPNHSTIFINIECKNASPGNESKALRRLGFKRCVPFDSVAFRAIDKEILSSISEKKLFTPKHLQNGFASIHERLDSLGWPTAQEMRNKIIFILDGWAKEYNAYSSEHLLFHYGDPANENTAFVIQNDPFGKEDYINSLTKKFIVRSRADAGTYESRNNDYMRLKAVLRSGSQIISTDYYKPDLRWSTYKVDLNQQ